MPISSGLPLTQGEIGFKRGAVNGRMRITDVHLPASRVEALTYWFFDFGFWTFSPERAEFWE